MKRNLKILAPVRYPWKFNGPRQSRHDISVRYFLPLNKIAQSIEGVTVFNPFPLRRFDLIHAFNRIPLGATPFVIGFKSHLPRAFGGEEGRLFRYMSELLAGERCKGVVAISDFARRQFLLQHARRPWERAVAAKLSVRYPNIPIPATPDAFDAASPGPVRLVFVGSHFGRKGGTVAVRLAELALQKKIDIRIDIVSALEVGSMSWIDPLQDGFFDRDLALLRTLPNIRHHGALPNDGVLALVRNAHYLLLPTFSDTFGFSAIEAMAQYTPAIGTRQGALPEFIADGASGLLLDLENNAAGEWKHAGRADRASAAYAQLFRAETDRLAAEALSKIESMMNNPAAYAALRKAARMTAEKMFSAADANLFWDNYYCKALEPA